MENLKLTPDELYNLRRAILAANAAQAEAEFLNLQAQKLTLEIEKKYELHGKRPELNFTTGEITVPTPEEDVRES